LSNTPFLPASINTTTYQGRTYFQNLPPNLVNRVYFDPNTTNLVFQGQFVDDQIGEKYLFLNVLLGADLAAVQGLCNSSDADYSKWILAVANLATPLYAFHENPFIPGSYVADASQTVTDYSADLVAVTSSEQQVDSYALSATGRAGLHQLHRRQLHQSRPCGEPVSIYIARVAPPLYSDN